MGVTTAGVVTRIDGDKYKVSSPYLEPFIERARQLGGKFDRDKREWVFDARDRERVNKELVYHYGTSGEPVPAVDVLVDLDLYPWTGATYNGFGVVVAQRSGRDSRVIMGDNVTIEKGGFERSGGSVKNPRVDEKSGTVLMIRDVAATLAQRHFDESEGVTIIGGDPVPDDPGVDLSINKSEYIKNIIEMMAEAGITIGEIANALAVGNPDLLMAINPESA